LENNDYFERKEVFKMSREKGKIDFGWKLIFIIIFLAMLASELLHGGW